MNYLTLKFKRPSEKTIESMVNSLNDNNIDKSKYHTEAESKISKLTNHKTVKLLNSGNSAVLTAMNIVRNTCILPDQGAWRGFKQSGKLLNKEIIFISTDKGLIDVESINEQLETINKETSNYKKNGSEKDRKALFLTSFAAYTAEQNIKEISKICHENDILLVEDASGSISDDSGRLANGKYSDIIIGSTGSPKVVNVGAGGFISYNDNKLLKDSNFLIKALKANYITCAGIYNELEFSKDILKKEIEETMKLKESLNQNVNVIHPEKRGINVIFENSNSKKLSFQLRKRIKIEGKSIITNCPNYDRVKEKAVSLEIKNISNSCLTTENMEELEKIVIEEIKRIN